MKIIIDEKHAEKIAAVLETVQKRAKVRTITTEQVLDLPERLREFYGIPKKYLKGLRVCVDFNAQDFPNAYKYTPESTVINIEFSETKCYLTDAAREQCRKESEFIYSYELPEEMQKALLKRFKAAARYKV